MLLISGLGDSLHNFTQQSLFYGVISICYREFIGKIPLFCSYIRLSYIDQPSYLVS